MKYSFLFIIFLPFISFSQDSTVALIFPVKEGRVYYEKIFNIDSTSKDELFKRAKLWAISTFNSQKDALQAEDKEIGFLVYDGFFAVPFNEPYVKNGDPQTKSSINYIFNFKIYVKENKSKVVLADVQIQQLDRIDPYKIESFRDSITLSINKALLQIRKVYRKTNPNYLQEYNSELTDNYKKANIGFQSLIDKCISALSIKSEASF
jgi:hypothetical protein